MRWAVVVALAGCHARLADDDTQFSIKDSAVQDGSAPVDSAPADAAPLGPWSTPMKVPGASDPTAAEDDSTMSWAGGELVFAIQAGGVKTLYTMTYTAGTFGTPTMLPFSGTGADDESPRFSPDDLNLYFASNRGGASLDIYTVHRNTIGGAWGAAALVTGPNTSKTEKWYAPCSTGYYLVIGTTGTDTDVFEGMGTTPPTRVDTLSSATSETGTYLSKDCLTAYFASQRDNNQTDLYMSTRASTSAPWPTPVKVTDFDTADNNEEDPFISTDGRTFTFARATVANAAQKDVYISTR